VPPSYPIRTCLREELSSTIAITSTMYTKLRVCVKQTERVDLFSREAKRGLRTQRATHVKSIWIMYRGESTGLGRLGWIAESLLQSHRWFSGPRSAHTQQAKKASEKERTHNALAECSITFNEYCRWLRARAQS
jgi:hypothetical protein